MPWSLILSGIWALLRAMFSGPPKADPRDVIIKGAEDARNIEHAVNRERPGAALKTMRFRAARSASQQACLRHLAFPWLSYKFLHFISFR